MEELLESLAAALLARRQTLATAESCTGGLIGAALTGRPGSSAWFLGGVVAYANSLKTRLLAVPEETLAAHGAVSAETARAMAEGARAKTGATWAVSVTGIAGPDGGTPGKPVGLVFLAVAGPEETSVCEQRFSGTRADVRAAATQAALMQLLARLERSARTP
jgi:PncC family amidohydrolase